MGTAHGITLEIRDFNKDNLDFTVTADGSNQVSLLFKDNTDLDCFVDWGDGTINFIARDGSLFVVQGSASFSYVTHTYSSGGDKRIKMYTNGENGTIHADHPIFLYTNLVYFRGGKRGGAGTSFKELYYFDFRANSAFPVSI